MATKEYQFTLVLRVHSPEVLYQAAIKHAQEVDGMSYTEAVNTLAPEGKPSVEDCLVMLLDPSVVAGSRVGCSYAERL